MNKLLFISSFICIIFGCTKRSDRVAIEITYNDRSVDTISCNLIKRFIDNSDNLALSPGGALGIVNTTFHTIATGVRKFKIIKVEERQNE